MSILIKGIGMPSNCIECPFCDGEYGTCDCIMNNYRVSGANERPEWCPLEEVPELATNLQQSCNQFATDCISRQAAIDYCYALINAENPSDPSDEWNYSQERINQTEVILHHLEFMPSAQPERNHGKWIYGEDYIGRDGWICDKCGHFIAWDYSVDLKSAEKDLPNYCPNCGADMRGEQNG